MKTFSYIFGTFGLIVTAIVLVGNTPAREVIVAPFTKKVETVSAPTPQFNNVNENTPLDTKNISNLDLNDKTVIYVTGVVDEGALSTAKQILAAGQDNKPIYLLIDSPGGSVLDGAQVVSAIEASKVPVYTVCLQLCASMAFIIHQYGTERYMVDRSLLMAHPASGGLQGNLQQMQSRLTMISSYVNKMDAYIAKRAGLPLDTFHALSVSELWLDAEDALKQKFADKIVSVSLKEAPSLFSLPGVPQETLKDKVNLKW